MTRHVEDHEIRQYLLGRSSEQDETTLEAAYFGDPALLQRIEAMADDLADEYVSGHMPQADRAPFERRLLASEEGREDIAFAEAFRRAKVRASQSADRMGERNASRHGVGGLTRRRGSPREPLASTAWSGRLATRHGGGGWLAWAAAAVLIVGGAYLGSQLWSTRDRPSEASSVATTPAATPAPAPEPPVPAAPEAPAIRVATLVLTGDLARSEGQPPTLMVTPDITHLDLVLPPTEPGTHSREATVTSVEGKRVWSGPVSGHGPDGPADRRMLVRVPAGNLPPGDYLVRVYEGATYFFRVRNRE